MDKDSLKKILLTNPWFRELPSAVIEEMIEMAVVRQLHSGQMLYVKNDQPEGLYGVVEGAIRVGACSAEGKQLVYGILEKGAWLGEVSLFDDQPRLSDAEAQGETKVLLIPRERFQAMLDRWPELYKHFMRLVCDHYRRAVALVEDNSLRTYPERLARHLLSLADTHGVPAEDGVEINLRLPQEELGMMAGTTRQRINQVLKAWERQGWIAVSYGRVTIKDRTALEALISLI